MRKKKDYINTDFAAEVIRELIEEFQSIAKEHKVDIYSQQFSVTLDDATWSYDEIDEFIADYRKKSGVASLAMFGDSFDLNITQYSESATIDISAPSRHEIESIFNIAEKNLLTSKLPLKPKPPLPKPTVFIGHGRVPAWRDLKDHLQDKHNIQVEAYETGARAGHVIRDILEEMIAKSSMAFLVLTAEDDQADGTSRARQNVIHEAGLFQGRLGFARAIVLLEQGVENFSNIDGIQYIPFKKDRIQETFGEVVATINREFPPNT